MSHTTTSIHNVIKIAVSEVRHADDHRWQKVDLTMSDGGTHSISIFLEPGCTPIHANDYEVGKKTPTMDDIRTSRMNLQGDINGVSS